MMLIRWVKKPGKEHGKWASREVGEYDIVADSYGGFVSDCWEIITHFPPVPTMKTKGASGGEMLARLNDAREHRLFQVRVIDRAIEILKLEIEDAERNERLFLKRVEGRGAKGD